MVSVFINPGSGPVDGATEENAIENINQFVKDCEEASGVTGVEWKRDPSSDDGGRYGFRIYRRDVEHQIEMPGLPLDRVRYVNSATQNIWHFPRLYVNGDSWVWMYAIRRRRDDWERETVNAPERDAETR